MFEREFCVDHTTEPNQPGEGIRFTEAKMDPDTEDRIQTLVDLETRRQEYIRKRQPLKLFALAREYASGEGHQPMPEMAIRIRSDARQVRRQLQFEREGLQK